MNAKQLREKLNALCESQQAILRKAADEKRDITEEERQTLAANDAVINQTKSDLAIAENLESTVANLRQVRNPVPLQTSEENRERATLDNFAIPRGIRRTKALVGFSNDRDAYASGRWILAALYGHAGSREWCESHGLELHAALNTGDGSKGGFLVPSMLDSAIVDLRESRGVFRQEATVRSMPTDTYMIPRRTGGLTAYFVGENQEVTASDKAWDQLELRARKLAAMCKFSSEIDEASVIDVASDIASEIAYAFAAKEDECGFNGDGTSTYGGIVGVKHAVLAGSEYTAATGNTAFGTLDLEDFEGMIGKLPQYALQNAKWYISRAGWAASMLRLAAAAGGNTSREIEGGYQAMFLGFPVVFAQVMNSTLTAQTSTEGLAYFGDLGQAATLGDRRGITLQASADRYFEYDQLAVRGTERIDINVHERGTASAAGSIISLLTPGS